ncbi:uncharacterized protein LOC113294621 [Papaver somniferum]|uniref:uncharacterized protein LOC113294621 n=1 Tax=Papaver somniferum TaxID=3469 RepID=UPI000E6FC404|nr:uncharacterized protein LOC113294621 [Papaver somniferum]
MCNSCASETPEHMLLHCSFSKSVWYNIPVVSQHVLQDSDTQISVKEWISKWFSTSHLQDHLVTAMTTAWCIWKDRCSKVFEDKILNSQVTARTVIRIDEDTVNSLAADSFSHNVSTTTINESNSFLSVPQDCLTIYCDASFDKDTNKADVGIVAMHSTCRFNESKLVSGRDVSPEEAKSTTLLGAAKWIKERNFQNIYLISDAKNVMACLNKCKGQISWTSCYVLDDCLFLLHDTNILCFKHFKRELNGLTDIAAKHSRVLNLTGEWYEDNCSNAGINNFKGWDIAVKLSVSLLPSCLLLALTILKAGIFPQL